MFKQQSCVGQSAGKGILSNAIRCTCPYFVSFRVFFFFYTNVATISIYVYIDTCIYSVYRILYGMSLSFYDRLWDPLRVVSDGCATDCTYAFLYFLLIIYSVFQDL